MKRRKEGKEYKRPYDLGWWRNFKEVMLFYVLCIFLCIIFYFFNNPLVIFPRYLGHIHGMLDYFPSRTVIQHLQFQRI